VAPLVGLLLLAIASRKGRHLRWHIAAKNLCTGLQLGPSWQMAGHDRVLAGTRLKLTLWIHDLQHSNPIGVSRRRTCVRGDVFADNDFPVGPYIFGLGIFEPR
jgi:hypothetical protein